MFIQWLQGVLLRLGRGLMLLLTVIGEGNGSQRRWALHLAVVLDAGGRRGKVWQGDEVAACHSA